MSPGDTPVAGRAATSPVLADLVLRGAAMDHTTATAVLAPPVNTLVVEVSSWQGVGASSCDWRTLRAEGSV